MGKLTNLFLGSAFLGAAAATVYTYIKNYKELAPETADRAVDAEGDEEAAERSYSSINMDAAKEAAKKTATTIKEQSVKAWGVAKDSAKAVYDNVMENNGPL